MISIKDVKITDLLPFMFKTDEIKALARAVHYITSTLYQVFLKVLFWTDIEHADPCVLDAMAAELDCPFYSVSANVETKRSLIQAAFAYNRKVGTVSAVGELLGAAFGTGEVQEWYTYGGMPGYFKIKITSSPPLHVTKEGYELFLNMLDRVKNKRSKLEGTTFARQTKEDRFIGTCVVPKYTRVTIWTE
jgi:P2-related tail formation protein|nr:MAG TPA: tail protein [Caudoviricetes sp.]